MNIEFIVYVNNFRLKLKKLGLFILPIKAQHNKMKSNRRKLIEIDTIKCKIFVVYWIPCFANNPKNIIILVIFSQLPKHSS